MNRSSYAVMLRSIMKRELRIAWRRRSEVLAVLFFFLMVVGLFPLGMAPDASALRLISAGVLWVALVLAMLQSLGRLFASDYADGSLEQMSLLPQPLYWVVLGKTLTQCTLIAIPFVLIAPVAGLQLGISLRAMPTLMLSLLLGLPVLTMVGSIGAALTLGIRGGNLLVGLLVMPLYIPALIFGSGAVETAAGAVGSHANANIYLLGAVFTISVVFMPWATAAALRIALE